MTPRPTLPRSLAPLFLAVACIALGGVAVLALDLYRGLADGAFMLVRGTPVTVDDGFRYTLIALGEGLGVLVLLGCAGLMLHLASLTRRTGVK